MYEVATSVLNALCPTDTSRDWRPVKGFEDRYIVSSDGYVVSLPRTCAHIQGERRVRLRLLKRREVFQNGKLTGVVVKLSNMEIGVNSDVTVGRLMLEAFIGANDGHVAHFKDGDPKNLSIDNLEWSTWSDIAFSCPHGKKTDSQHEMSKVRKMNLKTVIESKFAGSFNSFVHATGKASSQMSNILRDKATNGIGSKLARELESTLDLPAGLLDIQPSQIK